MGATKCILYKFIPIARKNIYFLTFFAYPWNQSEVFIFWVRFIFWGAIIAIVLMEFHFLLVFIDKIICVNIKKQIPFVASSRRMRHALIAEIQKHYSQYKTAVDIGAGDCALARMVARQCNMRVIAIENTWHSLTLARIKNRIFHAKKVELAAAQCMVASGM